MEPVRNIVPVKIQDELRTSFLDYSMSVIVSRALPDARDGLKPVHRRILFAMAQLRNFYNRPHLKSARIVGDVLGRFHPHGDSPVYEALVRLAQEFSMRYPLIDGQGNFGSIDGDSAAAMRYTESRLEKISSLMLADIDKETVDFVPNYDGKELEPTVLPAKIPQLLINGASGIAVGMATNIPPHNIREITSALLALLDDPTLSIERIMDHVKGPDFPTSAMIYGIAGIRQAYLTGHGSIVMRARAGFEDNKNGRERIVVTEIPYQVNKSRLIEKIAELVHTKRIEGISDIRDESNKEGIRIVIDLKKGENSDIILNNLYKLTPMQTSFGVNAVALVDGTPRVLNLKQFLEVFLRHRREVLIRRTAFELRRAEERGHILEGLKIAVENIDAVVAVVRKSKDPVIACAELISQFGLTEIQAKAILEMRLARLTGLERDKIIAEYKEVMSLIADLRDILATPGRITQFIREELTLLLEDHGDERRTEIIASAADEFTMESLVADDEVAVTVSHTGYVKRTQIDQISAQRRGGKGKSGMLMRDEDAIQSVFITSNHQSLLCFTNSGRVFEIKVYQLPDLPLRSRGKHFASLVKLGEGEKVVSVLPVKEFSEGHYICSVTAHGYVKKTDLMAYSNIKVSGIIALKLDDGDSLVSCAITDGKSNILIATRAGRAIRFNEDEVRPTGRASRGVTGIRLDDAGEPLDLEVKDIDLVGDATAGEDEEEVAKPVVKPGEDRVVGMLIVSGTSTVLSVCENGYGKRTPLEEYRVQGRGGKGIYTIRVTTRNGPVIGILQVGESEDLMVMTSSGKITRFNIQEIGVIGRLTQGVRLMHVESGEKVISVCKAQTVEGEEI